MLLVYTKCMKRTKIRRRQIMALLTMIVAAVGVWAVQLAQPQDLAPLTQAT